MYLKNRVAGYGLDSSVIRLRIGTRALTNMAGNIWVPQKAGNFLTTQLSASQDRLCFMELSPPPPLPQSQ
jgi:hypothetical protein